MGRTEWKTNQISNKRSVLYRFDAIVGEICYEPLFNGSMPEATLCLQLKNSKNFAADVIDSFTCLNSLMCTKHIHTLYACLCVYCRQFIFSHSLWFTQSLQFHSFCQSPFYHYHCLCQLLPEPSLFFVVASMLFSVTGPCCLFHCHNVTQLCMLFSYDELEVENEMKPNIRRGVLVCLLTYLYILYEVIVAYKLEV